MSDEPRHLPVDDVVEELVEQVRRSPCVVLQAPPGTGKTTRVPPALLAATSPPARVVMLEPRRVAARAAAERIAAERGERVGDVVGLRTRFDSRISSSTRLEVVTEGVLTRMLLADPGLDGIDVVVFDEFHERSIHADTALAFVRETMSVLRPDLRVVVMSATMDRETVSRGLETDAVLTVEAPIFPVSTSYRAPAPGRTPEQEVPDAVIEALRTTDGDILVFLAGAADIRRADTALSTRIPAGVTLTPLHGSLPAGDQDRALQPDPQGRRKVILSTPIAETSVTIDGVRVVIDTGRRRRPQLDLGRGMSGLVTVNASQAATDQRRGRAGRQTPGTCIRLWPEVDQARRRLDEPPEILTTDLTAFALALAAWGAHDPSELRWLDPPPPASLAAARGVLTALGAIDDQRRLTAHGRSMAALGTEPRLAHLLLRGVELGHVGTACDLAALLSDRDILSGRHRPADLRVRLDAMQHRRSGADDARVRAARRLAERWRRHFDAGDEPADEDAVGVLISIAFPDRIARRRSEPGSFLLASGAGVELGPDDPLAHEPLLAVAETDGVGADARIVTAAPLSREELEAQHGERIEEVSRGEWDRRQRDVVFERQRRLGALVIDREPDASPAREALEDALLAGVRREGLSLLRWSDADLRWRERAQFLHRHDPDRWPAFDDETLRQTLDDWLRPNLGAARRRADLEMLSVRSALESRLDWRQVREMERLAPTHITVPSGSRVPIDYAPESGPVLAVRLQEVFGLDETPRIADGAVALVLHLLSPAHRPVQVTRDLASFWREGYAEVRRELRGRYPKHHWPEDPTTAAPTNRAKKKRLS